jgi:hypothetical protein
MIYVSVELLRLVDDYQPGIVEVLLIDAFGQSHRFVEKIPLVTLEELSPESTYPRPGSIACEISAQWNGDHGRDLREITTSRPWGVESTSGNTSFVVLATQLLEVDGTTSSMISPSL